MACASPEGINKIAWGAKLDITADLANPVSCASLGHLPMAQPCNLRLNVYFSLPRLPTHPLPPAQPL